MSGWLSIRAATLGRRTAELHRMLASAAGPAFAPEPLKTADWQNLVAHLRTEAAGAFDRLKQSLAGLPDELVDIASLVLSRRRWVLESFPPTAGEGSLGQRIRIHGDYHLGQVLQVKTDFVILDFEGEPARTLPERRAKMSPLRDVAGMVRSFSYAAYAGLLAHTARRPEDWQSLEPWARLWERSTGAEFLRAYRSAAGDAEFLPSGESGFRNLLTVFLLNKVLYELSYELNNRPTWVRIPLMGILALPSQAGSRRP